MAIGNGLTLAPWGPPEAGPCPDGGDHDRVGFSGEAVHPVDGTVGIFQAWVYAHGDPETFIDVTFGGLHLDTSPDRVTFGTRHGAVPGQSGPACTLVTGAAQAPPTDWFGQRLTRDEALAHPWLPLFWEVVDRVLEHLHDPHHEHHHSGTCACGAELDEINRDCRFVLPDCIAALPEREHTPGVGVSATDPMRADFLESTDHGCFVRSLLRLPLTEGRSLTCGVWIRVTPETAQRIGRVWNDPMTYSGLVFEGQLANSLPHIGALDASVKVSVLLQTGLPRVSTSTDASLQAALSSETPWEPVFETLT